LACNADILQWIDSSTNAQDCLFNILVNPYIFLLPLIA